MDFDWKEIVKTVAPLLGTAIGGPVGGMATKFIAGALLGDEEASIEDIEAAVLGASPETMMLLKKADHDFKLKMEELGLKREDIAAKDRNSARDMHKANKEWIVPVLAGLTVAGFFATMSFVLMGKVSLESTILGFVLGQISAKTEQVYNFYFGSSAGSKEKTEHLASKGS